MIEYAFANKSLDFPITARYDGPDLFSDTPSRDPKQNLPGCLFVSNREYLPIENICP